MQTYEVQWFEDHRGDRVYRTSGFDTFREAEAFYHTRVYAGDTDGLVIREWDGRSSKTLREYVMDQPIPRAAREHIEEIRQIVNKAAARYNEEEA